MIGLLKELVTALKSSKALTALLRNGADSIRHLRMLDARKNPQIVYSIISDVPALSGDDSEMMRRVTVRIHIITGNGEYFPIADEVGKVMQSLKWRRVQTLEHIEDEQEILTIDYMNVGTSF